MLTFRRFARRNGHIRKLCPDLRSIAGLWLKVNPLSPATPGASGRSAVGEGAEGAGELQVRNWVYLGVGVAWAARVGPRARAGSRQQS